jgi:hypothetical protein
VNTTSTVSLTTPTLLTLLATHLQLLNLYTAIFARAFTALDSTTPSALVPASPFLDVHIGGFPITHPQLQLKILVQTLEYQLGLIERAIGLPAAYCVVAWQRDRDQEVGLLNAVDKGLVRAVMGGGGGEEAGPTVELRRLVAEVRRLLED